MNKPMWEKGQIFLIEEFQIIHINTPQPRGQHLIPPHLECGPDLVHSLQRRARKGKTIILQATTGKHNLNQMIKVNITSVVMLII